MRAGSEALKMFRNERLFISIFARLTLQVSRAPSRLSGATPRIVPNRSYADGSTRWLGGVHVDNLTC